MKKYILTFLLIGTFGSYALYQFNGGSSDAAVIPPSSLPIADTQAPANQPVQTPSVAKKPVASTPAKKPSTTGQYADGTYTGISADAYYGNIQVKATIRGGKLTDVQFLDYPQDRGTSRMINGMAMPVLRSEAIQAQSANVDTVSGATDSSGAFRQSLSSALAQAKA